MTTETIALTATCTGGGHLTFTMSGAWAGSETLGIEEMTAPITQEDRLAFLKVFVRMARLGRTANQARTLLQNGVTITI